MLPAVGLVCCGIVRHAIAVLADLSKSRWVKLRKEKQRIEPLKVQMWFFHPNGEARSEVRVGGLPRAVFKLFVIGWRVRVAANSYVVHHAWQLFGVQGYRSGSLARVSCAQPPPHAHQPRQLPAVGCCSLGCSILVRRTPASACLPAALLCCTSCGGGLACPRYRWLNSIDLQNRDIVVAVLFSLSSIILGFSLLTMMSQLALEVREPWWLSVAFKRG